MKSLVTHNGKFHADDVFACAVIGLHLDMQNEPYTVTRTRDANSIAMGDYVFDVGGEYDAARNRFDHHQVGRAGERPNGIPYSSVGLVWKQFGEYICGSASVAERIDEKVIQSLDAVDNGVDSFKMLAGMPDPFLIHTFLYAYWPTWKEADYDTDGAFLEMVDLAKKTLLRMVKHANDFVDAEQQIETLYAATEDSRLLILDAHYPWEEITLRYPSLLIVVLPQHNGNWKAETVFTGNTMFERRMYFPKKWAGLRDEQMAETSGVSDAIFCHTGQFIAVAKTKEGAIELARKALEA